MSGRMLVLLRRIVGGINASAQQALYRKQTSRAAGKKRRVNRQLEYEEWRLVASLEHLLAGTRALLGQQLVAKIRKEPEDAIWCGRSADWAPAFRCTGHCTL